MKWHATLVIVSVALTTEALLPRTSPTFTDVTAASGIAFVHDEQVSD
jgi:hypothetical protein